MSASKVYFTNFRATFTENLLQKLARLVKKAGMLEQIDFKNQYTAIKIHFGEPGNLAYLRPNYSKVIVDLIKEAERYSSPTVIPSMWADARMPWIISTPLTQTATIPLPPAAIC